MLCIFLLPWKTVRLLHTFNASASTFDWVFETFIIDSSLTLKRVTPTRWSCRADAKKALKHDYQQIKYVLKQIDDDIEEKECALWSKRTDKLRQVNHLEKGIYNIFWNDILQRTDATNKNLQHAKLDLNTTAVASLTSLKNHAECGSPQKQ